MSIEYLRTMNMWFPDPEEAGPDGLLAFGGDLSPERLVAAYANGIFPWYGPGEPILWWCPDPRLVLEPSELHIPRSLRRVINARRFRITLDEAFPAVIGGCAHVCRGDDVGTWLVPEMIEAYNRLHALGVAHSVEAWDGDELVGGLYGVAVGRVFFGESMFHLRPDASKVAFVHLARLLERWDYGLVDCQQTTHHLLRFGAYEISRAEFLERLVRLREERPAPSAWIMPEGFDPLR
ncbi:leucyl/phenylalanyl-tRNA--protein transferase [Desulfobaculum xiamenense]|uniref:Leucyl/phenylalanyl-tRNA--protein transferase n=1 Tax=Desulfobaculum xiamenense TaxID=995050 RepID=A0A846QE08_9BACT|nr:leucyl/phenylalanyl-tRNA--protein transferase [Desulfobaculum xiamenense]NJB66608.1 leucyl/phenylalanyl-tRNA--protein transferase [Desulfobaculum xiamenense]